MLDIFKKILGAPFGSSSLKNLGGLASNLVLDIPASPTITSQDTGITPSAQFARNIVSRGMSPSGGGFVGDNEAQRQRVEGPAPQISGQGDLASVALQTALTGNLGKAFGAPVNLRGASGALNPAASYADDAAGGAANYLKASPGRIITDRGAESAGYQALMRGQLPTADQHQAIYNEISRQISNPGIQRLAAPDTLSTLQDYIRSGVLTPQVQQALRNIYGGY